MTPAPVRSDGSPDTADPVKSSGMTSRTHPMAPTCSLRGRPQIPFAVTRIKPSKSWGPRERSDAACGGMGLLTETTRRWRSPSPRMDGACSRRVRRTGSSVIGRATTQPWPMGSPDAAPSPGSSPVRPSPSSGSRLRSYYLRADRTRLEGITTVKSTSRLVAVAATLLALGLSPASASADIAPQATATNTTVADATVNWPQFRFNSNHTGLNPFETVLNPTNVPSLQLAWQAQLGMLV